MDRRPEISRPSGGAASYRTGECPTADVLARGAAGDLPHAERAAFVAHVASCESCADLVRLHPELKSWADRASARARSRETPDDPARPLAPGRSGGRRSRRRTRRREPLPAGRSPLSDRAGAPRRAPFPPGARSSAPPGRLPPPMDARSRRVALLGPRRAGRTSLRITRAEGLTRPGTSGGGTSSRGCPVRLARRLERSGATLPWFSRPRHPDLRDDRGVTPCVADSSRAAAWLLLAAPPALAGLHGRLRRVCSGEETKNGRHGASRRRARAPAAGVGGSCATLRAPGRGQEPAAGSFASSESGRPSRAAPQAEATLGSAIARIQRGGRPPGRGRGACHARGLPFAAPAVRGGRGGDPPGGRARREVRPAGRGRPGPVSGGARRPSPPGPSRRARPDGRGRGSRAGVPRRRSAGGLVRDARHARSGRRAGIPRASRRIGARSRFSSGSGIPRASRTCSRTWPSPQRTPGRGARSPRRRSTGRNDPGT